MTPQQRALRARAILDDQVIKDALAAMERQAIEDFLTATRWWWGDRRRRIAAEHLREVRDFGRRLEMMSKAAPQETITTRNYA